MRRLLSLLYTISGWVAAICLVAIFVMILVQISFDLINRLVVDLTGESADLIVPSYGEFASYLLAASMFLGFATALNHGTHVRVNLALRKMSPAVRRVVEILATSVAMLAAGFFAYRATIMVHESWLYEDKSYGLIVIPMWIPQTPMAVGLIVLTIAFVDRLAGVLSGQQVRDADEIPSPASDSPSAKGE